MNYWIYLFIITSFSKTFALPSNVIYQFVNGNLSESWNLNFTLSTNDFKGMILYMVDSDLNKLSVKVTFGIESKKYIQLSYNNAFTRPSINQLCGCDPCNDKLINLNIWLQNKNIYLECNNYGKDSLKESWTKDYIHQSVLQKMVNKTNSIFIGMGNIDSSDDLSGCLKSFHFNNSLIKFKGLGTDFMSACIKKCSPGICNNGKCIERYPLGPTCDCSNAALNGRRCNRTLREYKQSNNMSFQRNWISKQIQFKLSWKQSLDLKFCLLDFIYKSGNFTLNIAGDYLMKDSEVINTISPGEINFINVNITDSRVIIKNAEKMFLIEMPLREMIKINVGFSEKKLDCKPFVGSYDLNYNSSQMLRFDAKNNQTSKINVKWIILPLLFVVVLIGVIFLIIFFKRRTKQKTDEEFVNDLMLTN